MVCRKKKCDREMAAVFEKDSAILQGNPNKCPRNQQGIWTIKGERCAMVSHSTSNFLSTCTLDLKE